MLEAWEEYQGLYTEHLAGDYEAGPEGGCEVPCSSWRAMRTGVCGGERATCKPGCIGEEEEPEGA